MHMSPKYKFSPNPTKFIRGKCIFKANGSLALPITTIVYQNLTMRVLTHWFHQRNLLTGQNIELMAHPPYSADLAPKDFLFPYIKKYTLNARNELPQ